MSKKDFLREARNAIGSPYIYGGQSPEGYDCSGLVIDCLHKSGWRMPDMNASQLCEHFHNNKILQPASIPGCLWFYGIDASNITHVMIVLTQWKNGKYVLIGARGGDSTTKNQDIAYNKNAFVSTVLGDYWKKMFQTAVDPFRDER